MADTQPAAPSNGASTALVAREAARAATDAELSKLSDAPAAEATSATTDGADAAGAGDVTETATQDDAVEAKTEAKAEPEKPADKPADKPDAETEKRLEAVQKAERRSREMIAKERTEMRAELEALKAEVQPFADELAAFKKAKDSRDPVAALKALGFDIEHSAKLAWQHHLAEKEPGNPQHAQHAARIAKERQADDKLTAHEQKLADLEAKIEQREQAQAMASALDGFTGDVRKSASGEAAILFEKAPGKAKAAVKQVLDYYWQEHGEIPDPSDVLAVLEKRLPEMLTVAEHRAIFGGEIAKPAPVNGKKPDDKPRDGKTLEAGMTGSTQVSRAAKSRQELREETDRMLDTGKVE